MLPFLHKKKKVKIPKRRPDNIHFAKASFVRTKQNDCVLIAIAYKTSEDLKKGLHRLAAIGYEYDKGYTPLQDTTEMTDHAFMWCKSYGEELVIHDRQKFINNIKKMDKERLLWDTNLMLQMQQETV